METIIDAAAPDFNVFAEQIVYCADLGLVTRANPVRFANPIYQESWLGTCSLIEASMKAAI